MIKSGRKIQEYVPEIRKNKNIEIILVFLLKFIRLKIIPYIIITISNKGGTHGIN